MAVTFSPLTVFVNEYDIDDDHYVHVTFKNELVSFNLYEFHEDEYYNAAIACKAGTVYNGTMFRVRDGIVTVRVERTGGNDGGTVELYLPSELCFDAFMEAHKILSEVRVISDARNKE